MKKLIVLLASSVTLMLAIGGLVVAQTASAATYPGTVATSCNLGWAKYRVSHLKRARVTFSVSTAGTGLPAGTVKVTAKSRNGHYYVRSYSYSGGSVTKAFRKMHRGRYVTRMYFTPAAGSVFIGCHTRASRLLRVR